jgi:hypothetical protein
MDEEIVGVCTADHRVDHEHVDHEHVDHENGERAVVSKSVLLYRGSLAAASAAVIVGLLPTPARADPAPVPSNPGWSVSTILSGSSLHHQLPNGSSEALSKPDDLTSMDGNLFVIFQNGVGPAGAPSPSGNTTTTVVEFTASGNVLSQWDVIGHGDGLTADPYRHRLIVTVNEDGNSSLYTIDPEAPPASSLQHFVFWPNPLPHGGGTDAVSFYNGQMLISASAPTGTNVPAVYDVFLFFGLAVALPVFNDNAVAQLANGPNQGAQTTLALTDPDSNEVVPGESPRFAHDFVLDSQGDQQQIYLDGFWGFGGSGLQVLDLSQSVNDTAWATRSNGTLYVSDGSASTVSAIRGPFSEGTAFVAVTPCSANSAPSTCPAPGFPANYLGTLNMFSGLVSPWTVPAAASLQPQGLLFVGPSVTW